MSFEFLEFDIFMMDLLKKNWKCLILFFILILAVFVRAYRFDDQLLFELDQGRDAKLISEAVDKGPSYLPLLGPRAAGTYLRLGPVFYYFQYLSAEITNSIEPSVFAYPDLLFSVLTIPLFYFFLRLYFGKLTSALTAAMYAFSFAVIQYSRFAWNPNSLPFWILVCFYGLVRVAGEVDKRKRYIWIAMMSAGLAVASQLHFLAFVSLPAIIVLYLLWTKSLRKFGWKETAIVLLILVLFYLPVILSDLKTSGDNVKQFVWAFKNKPQDQQYSFGQKLMENAVAHSEYYFNILTSYKSRLGKFSLIGGLILVLGGLFRVLLDYRPKISNDKKRFLKLIIIWFAVSFLALTPFAFKLKTRFFMLAFPLPFVFAALWMEWLVNFSYLGFLEGRKCLRTLMVVLFSTAVIALNTEATAAWYRGLAANQEAKPILGRALIIKQDNGITLNHLRSLSDFIYGEFQKRPAKIYLYGNLHYRIPVEYLLNLKRDDSLEHARIKRKVADPEAYYFNLTTVRGAYKAVPDRYADKFDLMESYTFGRLMLHRLKLKKEQPPVVEEKIKEEKNDRAEDSVNDEDEREEEKLGREERVRWRDLFKQMSDVELL